VEIRWFDDESAEDSLTLLLPLAPPPPLRDHRRDPDNLVPMVRRQTVNFAHLLVATLKRDQGAGIKHDARLHAALERCARGRDIRARNASRSAAVGIESMPQLAWSSRAASILRWSSS